MLNPFHYDVNYFIASALYMSDIFHGETRILDPGYGGCHRLVSEPKIMVTEIRIGKEN